MPHAPLPVSSSRLPAVSHVIGSHPSVLSGPHGRRAGNLTTYVGDGTSYMRAYTAALLSAKKYAPSLLPVLAYVGAPLPRDFTDWVKQNGGIVLNHNLTITQQLTKAARTPGFQHTKGLWGSYLRMEPHLIMDQLVAELQRTRGAEFVRQLDTSFALWTDPDVLFGQDINSCTIPKPHIMSIGPESTKDGSGNCGVIYYNLINYK